MVSGKPTETTSPSAKEPVAQSNRGTPTPGRQGTNFPRNATTTDLTNTNTYHLNSASRRRGPQCVLCIRHGDEKGKRGKAAESTLCTQILDATFSIGVQCSILRVYTRGELNEEPMPRMHTHCFISLTASSYSAVTRIQFTLHEVSSQLTRARTRRF